jgi:hypothetical protein
MGIRASIYRDDFQPTHLNVFGSVNNLTIVNAEGPFQPDEEAPAALITYGYRDTVRIVPAILKDGEWTEMPATAGPSGMFGGAYVATSDSRFSEATGMYGAVALHDWYESWEQYDANFN